MRLSSSLRTWRTIASNVTSKPMNAQPCRTLGMRTQLFKRVSSISQLWQINTSTCSALALCGSAALLCSSYMTFNRKTVDLMQTYTSSVKADIVHADHVVEEARERSRSVMAAFTSMASANSDDSYVDDDGYDDNNGHGMAQRTNQKKQSDASSVAVTIDNDDIRKTAHALFPLNAYPTYTSWVLLINTAGMLADAKDMYQDTLRALESRDSNVQTTDHDNETERKRFALVMSMRYAGYDALLNLDASHVKAMLAQTDALLSEITPVVMRIRRSPSFEVCYTLHGIDSGGSK